MRIRAIIFRIIMSVVAAGFLISPAYSTDKKTKKPATNSERGLKVVSKGDGRRIALVIGNSDYKYTGTLTNPANDARLIAETLKSVGFELYGGKPQINLSRDDMLNAIEGFGDRIGRGDTALFFYAGHGMQVKGENYLIPVNANIKNEAEVRVKSVESSLLFAKLEGAKNGVNIVILDACRNNPFGRSFRSGNNGLAQVAAPSGTIVAFSTAPNQVAEDGSSGNSTYTRELARFIKSPGLRIEDVFKRVRISVEESTSGNQQPWENTSLKGDFSFVESVPSGGISTELEQLKRDKLAAQEDARKALEQVEVERRARETAERKGSKTAMAPRPPADSTAKKKGNFDSSRANVFESENNGFKFYNYVVEDTKTGLMWVRDGNVAGKELNWYEANKWTSNLNYGGYNDWRLPTIEELKSLSQRGHGGTTPATRLDAIGFRNTQPSGYWSSTQNNSNNSQVWYVLFHTGKVGNDGGKTTFGSIRAVRNVD